MKVKWQNDGVINLEMPPFLLMMPSQNQMTFMALFLIFSRLGLVDDWREGARSEHLKFDIFRS